MHDSNPPISTPLPNTPRLAVIIPAYNEENSVGKVIADIPKLENLLVLVVNNNSNDQTELRAAEAGATVLTEKRQGYGFACLKGLDYLANLPEKVDVVLFLDADYSDYPAQMLDIIRPILDNKADLVIGSRALGRKEAGSMTLPQRFGNWLATFLIRWLYKISFTDLGPFRAIRYDRLLELKMQDQTYGWTVEMQVKAAKMGLRCVEVPVDYRRRVGYSKVSGTIKGVIGAGYKIITTIFKYL